MGIDDIAGPGAGEQLSNRSPVIERMNLDGLQKRSEPGLTPTVSPDLCNHWIGRVESPAFSLQRRDHHSGRFFVPIDRDQEPGIEHHNW